MSMHAALALLLPFVVLAAVVQHHTQRLQVGLPVQNDITRAGVAMERPSGEQPAVVDTGPTHHSGQIDTNEVWYPSGNPHILDSDVYTGNDVTLTIMPGCVVKADCDVELYTGYAQPGAIVATGTADSVIVFTSNIGSPGPGDWRGVGIYDQARNVTVFSHCVFSYAGGIVGNGTVYIRGAALSFNHCRISQSGDCGVYADRDGRFNSFTNNTIATCADYPVCIKPDYARTLGPGNVLTGNSHDGILVFGGNVSVSGTWLNHGVPYVIASDVGVSDAANNPVLTIAAGAKLMFRPRAELYVGYAAPGGLIADGTSGQIEFTSSVEPPSPGDWYSVGFYKHSVDAQCRLVNCKVEYGGGYHGNVIIHDAIPEVHGDSIGHSAEWGIYLQGSEYPDPEWLLANNTFYDCASGAVGPNLAVAGATFEPCGTASEVTFVRGVLFLPLTLEPWAPWTLVSTTGRKVMDLKPGENDIRHIAPGVCFVREEGSRIQGSEGSSVRKVVIQR
jgi:hypothetical protein